MKNMIGKHDYNRIFFIE